MILKNWIILPLLCSGLVLIAWICPSSAAQLKDIRVGEYETHTRIVFEFSGTDSREKISPLESGQLSIIFQETDLALIRKIPLDRSYRLKEMKIWERQNDLSLVLSFKFDHFRYELSKISEPNRIVLDVFQLSSSEASDQTASVQTTNQSPAGNDKASGEKPSATDQFEPLPADNIESSSEKEMTSIPVPDQPSETPVKTQKSIPQEESSPTALNAQKELNSETESPSVAGPAATVEPKQQIARSERPTDRPTGKKRLQYYLAVALVILTLIILVLLLIMLVSRSRWANANSRIKSKQFLERQDERIAALDAKIQEQLKRYDKA